MNRLYLMAAVGMLMTARAATSPAKPPALESLAHIAIVTEPRINPDGTRVAFVASDSLDPTLTQIWMIETHRGSFPRPFAAGGRAARAPRWSPDGEEMLFLSARSDTSPEQIQIIDLSGGESRALTGEARGVAAMEWSPDGTRVAYVTSGISQSNGDPQDASSPRPASRLRVRNMADGTTQTISPDTASVWDFQWSPDGKKLAVLFTRPGKFGQWRRGMLAVAQADGSLWKRLPGRADPTQGVAWSPDGEALAYYALPAARYSYPVLHTIGANGKRLSRLTPPDLPETEEGVLWTSSTGLIVSSFVGARCFITRIDPETGSRIRLVERSVPAGGAGASLTASRGGHLAFTSESFDHPAEVFILDHGAAASRRLTRMNSQLEGLSFPSPRVVHWTTFDGLRIEGILFLPPESIPRPVPLIVLPHGGPAWQWSLGFYADPLNPAPLLVAQGYALLFPNPRGSTGYGEGFSALNRGDLGGGDFRDIEAGVDSLVGAGVADPRRLAMSGYSYGGYMTAWTIAHTDRYRCAIIGAGPMNFYSDYSQNDLTPYWQQEFLGASPYQDPMVYLSRSPIFHVRNIWTPALIIHGADDVRVPLAQSQEMYTALKELGRTVEFYIYPREGHGLREPKHQIEFMKRQLEWFAGYLRPRNEG